jgi:GNAT superfamily N-acetyltransferase
VEIRDLTAEDVPFLQEMLYAAVTWRPGENYYPLEMAIEHPELIRYHSGWGRPGDVGLVAWERDRRVGAVWWRLFTADDHGQGYIDDQTPELAIAVIADRRSSGVGRALMEAAHDRGRSLGLRRISLSADGDNPARALYASLGYVEYEPDDANERMVLDL